MMTIRHGFWCGPRLADIAKSLGSVGKCGRIDRLPRAAPAWWDSRQRGGEASRASLRVNTPAGAQPLPSETNGHAIIRRAELLDAIKRARLAVEKNSPCAYPLARGRLCWRPARETTPKQARPYRPQPSSARISPWCVQPVLSAEAYAINDEVCSPLLIRASPAVLTAQAEEAGEDSEDPGCYSCRFACTEGRSRRFLVSHGSSSF